MFFSQWFDRVRAVFSKLFASYQNSPLQDAEKKEVPWTNPYLQYSRQVMEQILAMRDLEYRTFRPILIDTDSPDQVFGEADDVDQVLSQMEEGLNFLEICTDRPDYFASWKTYMEENYGLIVRILPKGTRDTLYGNMVIDFERHTPVQMDHFSDKMIYLPFQKIRWEEVEQESDPRKEHYDGNSVENPEKSDGTCLDIKVPIGYNRLIVRVSKK